MKAIATAALLAMSGVFLIVGIARKEMRTSGIVKIQPNLPQLFHREALKLPHIPIPDSSELPDVPNDVESVISSIATRASEGLDQATEAAKTIATRVSEGLSEATGTLNFTIGNIPRKITIGTDQICYLGSNNKTSCKKAPLDTSALFPSPLSTILDLDVIPSSFSAILKINVRSCLIAALIGVMLFAILLIYLDTPVFGVVSIIPFLQTMMKVGCGILVIIPLLLAAVVTFSAPSLLRKIDMLAVENGDLVWCLGIVLGLVGSAIGLLYIPCWV
ncbi:hypothetical protein F5Y13DRAFT_204297 [Hypoxylon sp. FL1857]|nr:hypothetical protein F5Y13DRAFT_204297 [Hypoxylon sp. FL1857]